ncbi:MAG TPA: tetratricopeptide repeat-containing sensor histidine kinase [Clostridiales bacterium]|nr:tetratricopeptide repeat-containing sensor histidine kinase [Clostridiales bacterium]HQP69254.1 tetratricopeptide repeat-containing sensor histidine kinase [Clostridiales bacterium]
MRFLIVLFILSAIVLGSTSDSLKAVVDGSEGRIKYDKSVELAKVLYESDNALAFEYLDGAIDFAETENEPVLLMKARYTKGDVFYNTGDFKAAGEEYKNSLIIAEKLNDTEFIYENCKQLGGVFYSLSDYKTSSIFYFKALDDAKMLNDEIKEANALRGLGVVFEGIKDFNKAHDFLNQSLEIYQKNGKMSDVADVYNNIAITYNFEDKPEEALNNFEKALSVYKNLNDVVRQAKIFNNMASIYVAQNKNDKAIENLEMSNEIFVKVGDRYGIALNDHNFGRAYFNMKDFKAAISYFDKSNMFAENMEVQELIMENYYFKAKADSATGDYKKAYEDLLKYTKADEKISSVSKQREIYEAQAKFELSQKEKQNFSLIRDNEFKKLEIEKQRQINNFFIIILLLIAGLALLAYRSFTQKAENQKLLKEYSEQIAELNKKLLEDIEKAKSELNESNEKLRKSEKEAARLDKLASLGTMVAGITHEIKNPTQVIKFSMDSVRLSLNDLALFIYDLIKLNKKQKKNSTQELKKLVEKHKVTKLFNDIKNLVISNKKSVDLIDQIVKSTANITHFNRETTDNLINDIVNDVLVIMRNSIKYSANVELALDPNLPRYKCSYQEISQILINLLTNARDAISDKGLSSGEGYIKVVTGTENSNIFIEVTDNGTGISQEDKDRIFEAFYTTKKSGAGQGLGLSIVKNIVDTYGGFISIRSEKNEGSTFRISFPVSDNADSSDKVINKSVEEADV